MHGQAHRVRVRHKVWLDAGERFAVGDGGVDLLRAIDETGSIRAAARRVEWSYRHALAYLDNAEAARSSTCGPSTRRERAGRGAPDSRRGDLCAPLRRVPAAARRGPHSAVPRDLRNLVRLGGNEYNRSEAAGAFGDLGTLVPFVVGYITINRLDPQAVLLGFGLVAIATGLYFRTPMPVQPMKAIATVAVTHPSRDSHRRCGLRARSCDSPLLARCGAELRRVGAYGAP